MAWYFVAFTWVALTTAFYGVGVWTFQIQHRYFPLRWHEVAYIMLASVALWWLTINTFAYTIAVP